MFFQSTFLFFLLICNVKTDDEIAYVKALRNRFLKSNIYDRFTRPVQNLNETTKVTFLIVITTILDLDLQKELLSFDALVLMHWNDSYLKWDPKNFGNLKKLKFKSNEVWIPELYVWNDGADVSKKLKTLTDSEITVTYNGLAHWITPMTFNAKCELDLKNYPFDSQNCIIYFGSSHYSYHEVRFEALGNSSTINGPWNINIDYLVDNITSSVEKTELFDKTSYSTIEVDLKLTRRNKNYYYFITLPHILSIIFCLFMFNFPIYSGLRILFCFISILFELKIIYFVTCLIGFRALVTPVIIKLISINILLVGILFTISVLIRKNILFLYSKISFLRNLEKNFLFKYFYNDQYKSIDNELNEFLKNKKYLINISRINNTRIKEFNLLIQFTDNLLMFSYCIITILTNFYK